MSDEVEEIIGDEGATSVAVPERIQPVDLQMEMQRSYLDYAMSVIVGRALPDVRDGLKPVHRRVLYAMYDGGYRPTASFSKSSRIVGDVIGLLDALDIERAHLVGHDWGGTIGWFAAIRHPERFTTYTAVSTAHPKAMLDAIATDESQRDAMQYIKTFREPDAAEHLMADDWRQLREGCHDLPRATFDEHARLLAEPALIGTTHITESRLSRADVARATRICLANSLRGVLTARRIA